MDDQRLMDHDVRRPVLVPFFSIFRVLILLLYAVAFVLVLYLFIGTDAYWGGLTRLIPSSMWEATVGTLIFGWFLASAVTLLIDGGSRKIWKYFRGAVAAGHVLIAAFYTWFLLILPVGWFFPLWVTWWFCVALPILSSTLIVAVMISLRKSISEQRRPRLYGARQVFKWFAAVSITVSVLSISYWYFERPTYSFPDMNGSILEFNRAGVSAFCPRTGQARAMAWDEASFTGPYYNPSFKYFCAGPSDTLILGEIYGRSSWSLCIYVPFDDGISTSESLPVDAARFSNVDYFPPKRQFLLTGTYNTARGLLLTDSNFLLVADYTEASGILMDGWPEARAFFIDSTHFLLAYSGQCEVFATSDSSRSVLVEGRFRAISPDRSQAIVSRGDQWDERHFLVTISTGAEEVLHIQPPRVRSFSFSPDSQYLVYSLYRRNIVEWTGRCYIYDLKTHTSTKTPLAYQDAWISQELGQKP